MRRNTPAFTGLTWASFVLSVGFLYVGLWHLEEPLMVKGYYAIAGGWIIHSAFTLAKVIRDNGEDGVKLNLPPKDRSED